MRAFFHNLRQFAETIRIGLCKMNEIQFNAPWAPRRSRCH
jgi:hypothetical protein